MEAWRGIVGAAGDVYREDLAFGAHAVGFPRHRKEELSKLERDFEQLLGERQKAVARPGAKPVLATLRENIAPPAVTLQPVAAAEPGRDLRIAAKVVSPAGVKWVRLRYRHLTQYEDYQTAEMTFDKATGLYAGTIPAAFIDPGWDLMYFVEAVDNRGAGRMYPDLEVEMPYVVVGVKR